MPKIHVTTFINAPIERVFDLSRNLTICKKAIQNGKEQVLSGTSGLISSGETITYKAKHLGKIRVITARITEMLSPEAYTEEQVKGDLKSYRHEHHFRNVENGTIMIDMLEFEGPRDLIGSIAGRFYLKGYLENLLKKKNELIRQYAESEKWRAVLG